MANIKIPGVKAYESKGKLYAYHRETGVRMQAAFGSPEFFNELSRLDASVKLAQPMPGTLAAWGQLVHAYTTSPKFQKELRPRTKKDYRAIFDWLDKLAGMPLEQWTRGFVVGLRGKAHQEFNWRYANYVVSVVSSVFTWAVDQGLFPENQHPVRKVKKLKRPKDAPDANRPWSDEEWQAVICRAPPHLLAPLLLCGVLGWREGEAVNRPKGDYNPVRRTIKRISSKSSKLVETPVPKDVAAALDALLPHDAPTLLVTSRGTAWSSEDGFRGSVFKLFRTLRDEGLVDEGLTVHGLRHTVATRMREAGYDLDTIKDMLGQNTLGMAEHYSKRADLRKKLKGVIDDLDQTTNKVSPISDF